MVYVIFTVFFYALQPSHQASSQCTILTISNLLVNRRRIADQEQGHTNLMFTAVFHKGYVWDLNYF